MNIHKEYLKNKKERKKLVLILVLMITLFLVFYADNLQQKRFDSLSQAYENVRNQEYTEALEKFENYLNIDSRIYWYHSCEHRLADLYNSVSLEYRNLWLFRDASYYSREVDNYINPREDYYGYSSQYLEMDSEKYAEFGVKKYYEQIEEWTNERD